MSGRERFATVLAVFGLMLAGCGPRNAAQDDADVAQDEQVVPQQEQIAPEASATPAADKPKTWVAERDGLRVSKDGFEDRGLVWPLTVDTALIGCTNPELLWVEADGKRYGINGMGQTHLKLPNFDDVWEFDAEMTEAFGREEIRLFATDLMNTARDQCD